jgi:hypothetical protein
LPIRINDRDYCVNGTAQNYLIKNPLAKSTAKSQRLRVRIEFILKPGSAPELRVRDENNEFQIETELRDRQEISYNCIPLSEILQKRQREANIIPNQEKISAVVNTLEQLHRQDYYIIQERNYLRRIQRINSHIEVAYAQMHRSSQNGDLLLNINPLQASLEPLQEMLSDSILGGLVNIILNYLKTSQTSPQSKGTIKHFIILLGKTYKFPQILSVEKFFNKNTLNLWRDSKKFGRDVGEYFKFLSRVAIKKEFQVFYFKELFEMEYQQESYLWGYGRILAWYSEFEYTTAEFEYSKHFKCILNHLLDPRVNVSNTYLQNALLSLIYLLTFREIDELFCVRNSEEFELAKMVIDLYRGRPVRLNRIGKNKSLNQYFYELLCGTSSGDAIANLLQVD